MTSKPCCFVCGKELPRYALDAAETCGADPCRAWAKKRDRELKVTLLWIFGILAAMIGAVFYVAERYRW